ncbi:sushi, von Willebrand factor type A, EGF and pentraxin domain-containing protein 1-like [Ruditapes philippinarum]|uniref:sushi, von Willebrand factor type A, EGF and pentraxin domain-containing protein 1-like n=1 Tax=Ruditapes philippinarum TaxID=129788 RepID=UPI00295BF7E9|nr:sushi, von Willebrand factor type A, EGF and pentraxin domain-containing protein 1-like [Ruditapes philippinarum]
MAAITLILELIVLTCMLMTEVLVVDMRPLGCPLLNSTGICLGSFVRGSQSNRGDFNEIGSIIKAFTLPGQDDYLLCQEDGTYNSSRSCLIEDKQTICSTSNYQTIRYLIRNPSQSTFLTGRVLSFSCEPGFTLEGPESVYCRSYNNWSDNTIPRCTRGCPYPGHLDNGYYTDSNGLRLSSGGKAINEYIIGHCNADFSIQGNKKLTCLRNGQWNNDVPKCVAATCGVPIHSTLNGTYIFPNGSYPSSRKFQIGDNLILICEKGFSSLANDYITCGKGGHWSSGHFHKCQPIKCGNPDEVENGGYLLQSNSVYYPYSGKPLPYGISIYVSCLDGFYNDGNPILVCTENGSWSGAKPICTKITCNTPLQFENGWYEFKGNKITVSATFKYKEKIYAHCNEGYILMTHSQRTCIKLNEWSEPKPICKKVLCAMPMSSSSGYYKDLKGDLLTQKEMEYNTNITFYCTIGYELTVGTFKRRCDVTGNWSGSNPKCSPITCIKPNEVCGYYAINRLNDLQSNLASDLPYNTTLRFVCNDSKYSCKNNSYMLQCLEGGNWHGNKPHCEKVKEQNEQQYTTRNNVVIGIVSGVVSIVIVLACITTFLICWRRRIAARRSKENSNYDNLAVDRAASDADYEELNIVNPETGAVSTLS